VVIFCQTKRIFVGYSSAMVKKICEVWQKIDLFGPDSVPPNQLLFFYQTGRNHKNSKKLLELFNGVLQTDGYAVYETLDSKLPNLRLISCMAHIRRGFFEAKSNDENRANTALIFIQQFIQTPPSQSGRMAPGCTQQDCFY
jgi:Transposase IS66 family